MVQKQKSPDRKIQTSSIPLGMCDPKWSLSGITSFFKDKRSKSNPPENNLTKCKMSFSLIS